jgi:hypothetical protein
LIENPPEVMGERLRCNFSGGRRDKRGARGQQALAQGMSQGMADVGV